MPNPFSPKGPPSAASNHPGGGTPPAQAGHGNGTSASSAPHPFSHTEQPSPPLGSPKNQQVYTGEQAKAAASEALQNNQFISSKPATAQPAQGQSAPGKSASGQRPSPPSSGAVQQPAVGQPAKKPKRLGELLVDKGLISNDNLMKALSQSKASKMPIGLTLVRMGLVSDEALGQALAELHHVDYMSLKGVKVPNEVLKVLPEEFMQRHLVLPIHVHHELRRIEVVMARPDVLSVLDEIALITGYRAVPKVSTHQELISVFDQVFKTTYSGEEALRKLEEDFASEDSMYSTHSLDDVDAGVDVDDAPVVMLVNAIMMEAIDSGASDIHIEPQHAQLMIRFRVDGILKEIRSIPRKMAGSVISRIKVSSGMDIAERRRPQDGRMKVKHGSQEVDMRVSSIPVQFGEKICIRLLRSNAMTGGLSQLGLTDAEMDTLTRLIKAPNGIILVTGPTGSGKTTTLYSCLREINSPEVNISTAEDPIEYPLAGINQVPINAKAGVTFSNTLRALLRQDPDVILVGEIRDNETLESAIHAAMTGHLVFSTLHTNSASKTVTRLLDMGAPSYLVSSSVVGILAQRLVRKLCPSCRTSRSANAEEMRIMQVEDVNNPPTVFESTGCQSCDSTGYKGRTPVYEFLRVSREIQELIDQGAPTFAIQDMAVQQGMSTLGASACRKVLEGETSLDEVTRVFGVDLDLGKPSTLPKPSLPTDIVDTQMR